MSEREVVLDQPVLFDEAGEAVRQATERAEKAEAELAKLKNAAAKDSSASTSFHSSTEPKIKSSPDPTSADGLKDPPSPSSAHAATSTSGNTSRQQGHAPRDPEEETTSDGETELRKDSMMAHLLDSLNEGKDIGHYGRLVFAMVARHFLPHGEVVTWLTKDRDFSEEQAQLMLKQVEGRDYNPPKRDRILEWQSEQEFPILPNPEDPDCGNLYRNLKFPTEIYNHIGHYQEKKAEAAE